MNDWLSMEVEANGTRIHVTRTGGREQAIVLAHGITDDGLCWTPVSERLSSRYDLIMVDARGHGRSASPENGYDSVTQAHDLYGVIQALRLEKPVVMGHSMGAMTALVMAGIFPDVPRAIVLEDPPGWWLSSKQVNHEAAQFAERLKSTTELLQSMSREQIIALGHRQSPTWSDAELGPWADSKLRHCPKLSECMFSSRQAASPDVSELIRRITCPVLVLTADPALGSILSASELASLKSLIPHLEQAHIAGAGHSIRREQFSAYLDAVTGFLTRHKI
jgi:N-formylmaleamate deformylase